MTLRQKTLLVIGLTLCCLVIALHLSVSTLWLNGFAEIESQRTQENVERVTQALANDLMELNRTTRDWAAWDETYSFMVNDNTNYIQSNLDDATIANLRLNIILFINTAGQIVHNIGFDLQEKVTVPVPNSLSQHLADIPYIVQHKATNSSYTGIVLLPEGPLLIASQPILNNDRTAPIAGALIFGRFLNAAQVEHFAKLTQVSLAVYPFQTIQLPSDLQLVKHEISHEINKSLTPAEPKILVRPLSKKQIAGYTLVQDIQGKPGLLLRVDTPRDIYQQGQHGLHYLLGSVLGVGLVFGLATVLLLEKLVLSPLAQFVKAVRRIRNSGDLTMRVLTNGQDELSRLGTAINQLLATLQQSQQQLHKSQEQYRSVVNNVKEVIFQTDTQGCWTFLNPAWTEITGFSIEESLGQLCWQFIHPEDQWYYCDQFDQLIKDQILDMRHEMRYLAKDGAMCWLEIHSRLIIADGAVAGTAGVLTDVTERKLAQLRERMKAQELEQTLRELTQTQLQLIQSEKMSSLGQLVAGIAHEINNPINFISGNIEPAKKYIQDLLHLIHCYQQYYPNPPASIQNEIETIDLDFLVNDLRNLLDSMQVGSERICEIVQSLRNFSRLDEAAIKAVDIHEGIESTLKILQHRLKPKGKQAEIQVYKEYGNLPKVECYSGLLNQVLMNLIANAIDALEEKRTESDSTDLSPVSCIQIRTQVKMNDGSLNAVGDATSVVISIADNGIGMTQEVCNRLFQPFFTTKPIGKGTGLGLSISYRIVVEKHQGQLEVKSELGKGTEFTIKLPLRQSNYSRIQESGGVGAGLTQISAFHQSIR